jgi:hypothetical protein
MLEREQVFAIIDSERAYQDLTYNPHEVLSSGQTRLQRDLDVAPGILMLLEYSDKAKAAWTGGKGSNLSALQQVAKIAAIATRILERAGGSEELIHKGLR